MNIQSLEQVRIINEKLENLYGRNTVVNLPNFRLSYCGDLYEKRSGTFSVYSGDIFLREETGIREVKKYAYIDDDIWLIERLIPNPHQDVMAGSHSYECVYSFPKIDHVPPLRAIIFFMNAFFVIGGTENLRQPKTEKEALDRDNKRKDAEVKKARELLDTEFDYTEISMRLKHGSAVAGFESKINFIKTLEKM